MEVKTGVTSNSHSPSSSPRLSAAANSHARASRKSASSSRERPQKRISHSASNSRVSHPHSRSHSHSHPHHLPSKYAPSKQKKDCLPDLDILMPTSHSSENTRPRTSRNNKHNRHPNLLPKDTNMSIQPCTSATRDSNRDRPKRMPKQDLVNDSLVRKAGADAKVPTESLLTIGLRTNHAEEAEGQNMNIAVGGKSASTPLSNRKPSKTLERRLSAPDIRLTPTESPPSLLAHQVQEPTSDATTDEISTPRRARKYAGSAFSNSPAAHTLPLPKFGLNKITGSNPKLDSVALDASLGNSDASSLARQIPSHSADWNATAPALSASFDDHYFANHHRALYNRPQQQAARDVVSPRSCRNCQMLARTCDASSPTCSSCRSAGDFCTWDWSLPMHWQSQEEQTSPFQSIAPSPRMPIHTIHHIHQPSHHSPPPPPLHSTYHTPMYAPPVASHAFNLGSNAPHYSNATNSVFDSAEQLSQTLKNLLRVSPENE
ncbi:hypothetical protein SeLEV6574_g02437 [Synchytrium endobioticum]|nr:hypothetical protein SeLEV6574_g02437 [Synchytrium endobioticum]